MLNLQAAHQQSTKMATDSIGSQVDSVIFERVFGSLAASPQFSVGGHGDSTERLDDTVAHCTDQEDSEYDSTVLDTARKDEVEGLQTVQNV